MKTLPKPISEIYPFDNHYLEIGGGHRIHYLDEGEGEAVLMFHGNPTWSFYYRNLVLGLRDNFRCIASDNIGCGLSDKPQDYPYRLSDHIENAVELVEQLKLERFHLVVHDWGGPIGFGLATKMPEKVLSLTVLNTAAFLVDEMPVQLKICRLPILGPLLVRGLNLFARPAIFMAVTKPMETAVKAGYLFPYDSWKNRVATLRFVQDIPMNPSHPSYPVLKDIEVNLKNLADKPMLLCWGLKDFVFTDKFYEEWRRRFPQAEAHGFPKAGHYLLEDAGDEVLELVRNFLLKDGKGRD